MELFWKPETIDIVTYYYYVFILWNYILFVLYLKFRSFNIKAEKVDSRITQRHEQAVEWVAL